MFYRTQRAASHRLAFQQIASDEQCIGAIIFGATQNGDSEVFDSSGIEQTNRQNASMKFVAGAFQNDPCQCWLRQS
jgi:hypothetical protein